MKTHNVNTLLLSLCFLLFASTAIFSQIDVDHNSSGTSPHLLLNETQDNDFARIFFQNDASSDYFSIVGNLGSTDPHQLSFAYNAFPRLIYDFDDKTWATFNDTGFTFNRNSTEAEPNANYHEQSNNAVNLTFSNNQFADNRWIIKADPSGSDAIYRTQWKNIGSGVTTLFMDFDAANDDIFLYQDTEIDGELITNSLGINTGAIPAGSSGFYSTRNLELANNDPEIEFLEGGSPNARIQLDNNSGGAADNLIIQNFAAAGSVILRTDGDATNDFTLNSAGDITIGSDFKTAIHKGGDLGANGTAWDDVYYDDLHNQGAAAFTDRSVAEEIVNYSPYAKKPGDFDYMTERGLEELDPASLPQDLAGDNNTSILTDEMVTYNYKANYEQQLIINDLQAQVEELKALVNQLLEEK